jgi:hypothetical protein
MFLSSVPSSTPVHVQNLEVCNINSLLESCAQAEESLDSQQLPGL